jgi:pyruvate/2-oxoglutarate dehydrogenase complex dihydrolipoamide acyltransferase (E2) component
MATDTAAQQTVDVVTPAAGESVTEGTILEWHVKVGDQIKADDTIVEISTDKVDIELPSPASGVVTEILIEEGETVTVGQVIARIAAGASAAAPAPVARHRDPRDAPRGRRQRRLARPPLRRERDHRGARDRGPGRGDAHLPGRRPSGRRRGGRPRLGRRERTVGADHEVRRPLGHG